VVSTDREIHSHYISGQRLSAPDANSHLEYKCTTFQESPNSTSASEVHLGSIFVPLGLVSLSLLCLNAIIPKSLPPGQISTVEQGQRGGRLSNRYAAVVLVRGC
jgi:hypothetical protein